ncbi:MAG: acyl-CoA dehydrogenase family protein [Paracoccaceae bacterium]
MNFDLTEERQMLQDTLRRYLADKYTTQVRNDILDSEAGFSAEIWNELAELGIIGAFFADEHGGFGGTGFDVAVVFEELGRAGVVEPLMEVLVAGHVLAKAGHSLIEDVIGGGVHLAIAHGEPASRYDTDTVETQFADGKLSGRKAVVINAEAADHFVVSARDGETTSLYLVAGDAVGVTVQGYPLLAGGRAGEVTFENTACEALDVAADTLDRAFGFGIVAQCAETLGAMETATALTGEYLMTRQQFGRPIGTFQALQHRMADVLIELEQARSAVINAAGNLENDARTRDMALSAGKNLLGRAGRLVAEEAIQLHGGIAMTQEYELAHIAKRIVMADHRFGDTDYHLERFIELSTA